MTEHNFSISFGGQGKNMVVAYLLWFLMGTFGIHRFYLGKIGSGIFQLVLLAVGWITLPILFGVIPLLALGFWWLLDAYFVYKYVTEANDLLPNQASVLSFNTQQHWKQDLDQLEKLHDLHQKGALTVEEFEKKKTDLMVGSIVPDR